MSCRRFSYQVNGSLRKIVPIFGVIFDLDGTLTIPVLNFSVLRERLKSFNVLPGDDILASVEKRDSEAEKKEMLGIISEFEAEGRERFALQPGVERMLEIFYQSELKLAIITRNDHRAVEQFLQHLSPPFQDGKIFSHEMKQYSCDIEPTFLFLISADKYVGHHDNLKEMAKTGSLQVKLADMRGLCLPLILTRDFKPTKPDPAPVLHICKQWNIDCCNTVVIGDHGHDLECGKQAGSVTVLLNNTSNMLFKEIADHNVDTLMEFVDDLQSEKIVKSD